MGHSSVSGGGGNSSAGSYLDFANYWADKTVEAAIYQGQQLRLKKAHPIPSRECDIVNIDFIKPPRCAKSPVRRRNKSEKVTTKRGKSRSPFKGVSSTDAPKQKSKKRQKSKPPCGMRIAELAVPTKRHCLETWKSKYKTLPDYMIERLQQHVKDQRPVVQISDAIYCFKRKCKRQTKHKAAKSGAKAAKSKVKIIKNPLGKNDVKVLGAVFGHKIATKLIVPLNIILNSDLEKVATVISYDIEALMRKSRKINAKNKNYKLIEKDIVNKVTVWVSGVLDESSEKILEDQLRDFEEEAGPVLDCIDDLVDNVLDICIPIPETFEESSTSDSDESGLEKTGLTDEQVFESIGDYFENEIVTIINNIDFEDDRKSDEYLDVDEGPERQSSVDAETSDLDKKVEEDYVEGEDDIFLYIRADVDDTVLEQLENKEKTAQSTENAETKPTDDITSEDPKNFENIDDVIEQPNNKGNENDDVRDDEYLESEEIQPTEGEEKIEDATKTIADTNAEGIPLENTETVAETLAEKQTEEIPLETVAETLAEKQTEEIPLETVAETLAEKQTEEIPRINTEDVADTLADKETKEEIPRENTGDDTETSAATDAEEKPLISTDDVNETFTDATEGSEGEGPEDMDRKVTFGEEVSDEPKPDLITKASIDRMEFRDPSAGLLSEADESWPEDVQRPILRPSQSVSKSITSLGRIREVDEKSVRPEEESSKNGEIANNVKDVALDQKKPTDSGEQDDKKSTIEGSVKSKDDTASKGSNKKEKGGKTKRISDNKTGKPTGKKSTTRSRSPSKSSKRDTSPSPARPIPKTMKKIKEKKVKAKSKDTGSTRASEKKLETNIKTKDYKVPSPKVKPKPDYRVNIMNAPIWINRHFGEVSCSCFQILTKSKVKPKVNESFVRRWCQDLEQGYENLKMWNEWVENTTKTVCMLQSEIGKSYCPERCSNKEWIKLKRNIDKDVLLWKKLNRHTHDRLKCYRRMYHKHSKTPSKNFICCSHQK